MGSIYRRKRDGKPYGCYLARWRDGVGIMRTRSTQCRDRMAAQARLAEWEKQAERERAGIVTAADAQAADWAAVPVAQHIEDYVAALKGRGRTQKHQGEIRQRLGRMAQALRWGRLADLSRPRLERWMAEQHEAGMAARTATAYGRAAHALGQWLVRDGRLASNPFTGIHGYNAEADRRHVRRALNPAELGALLEAAERRPVQDLLTVRVGPNRGQAKAHVRPEALAHARRLGRERRLFYAALAFTGLRCAEARSLRVCDVDLGEARPCIQLRAQSAKARRGAALPLRADLAAGLRAYLAERLAWARTEATQRNNPVPVRLPGDAPLFPNAPRSVRVFDRDLVAAGLAHWRPDGTIAKTYERGRTLDMHSLRATFASLLAQAGVPLATASVLMRHSDPRLTMRHYVDPAALDTAGAVERLPGCTGPYNAHPGHAESAVGDSWAPIWAHDGHQTSDPIGHFEVSRGTEPVGRPSTESQRTVQVTAPDYGAIEDGACPEVTKKNGVPAGIRTPNLLIRSQMLYPIELRVRERTLV